MDHNYDLPETLRTLWGGWFLIKTTQHALEFTDCVRDTHHWSPQWRRIEDLLLDANKTGDPQAIQEAHDALKAALDSEGWLKPLMASGGF